MKFLLGIAVGAANMFAAFSYFYSACAAVPLPPPRPASIPTNADQGHAICGKKGPGVTMDGTCIIGQHVPTYENYAGWVQRRVTEYIDCRYIYMHCFDDNYVGGAPPQVMLESPIFSNP